METIKYKAFCRLRKVVEEIIWEEIGEFEKIGEAQEAVRLHMNKQENKLRCIFYWDGGLYRCSKKEDGIHGKVETVFYSHNSSPEPKIDLERFYDHENRIKALEKALKDFMEVGDHK